MNFLKRWWLPLLIISLPFERIPSLDVLLGGHAITIRLSLLLAVLGLAVFGFGTLRQVKWRPSHPYFWLLAYILVIAISSLISIDPSRSVIATMATVLAVGGALVVAVLMSQQSLPRLYMIIAITALTVSSFGVYQFFGDSLGLPVALTGLREMYVKAVFGFPRIQSTALEPLFFANYLLLPIILSASLVYARLLRGKRYYLLLGLLCVAFALTLSRGGFGGAIVALVVMGVGLCRLASLRSGLTTFGTITIGCLVAVGMIYAVTSATSKAPRGGSKAVHAYVQQSTKVTSNAGSADSDRVVNRRLALQAFKERPLLGFGIGSFGAYAKQANPLLYPPTSNSATVNNEYLEVLAETGLMGALTLIGFGLTLGWQVTRALRKKLNASTHTWIWALSATMVAYLIQYYAFSTLYIMNVWVTVGLLMGLVLYRPSQSKVDAPTG